MSNIDGTTVATINPVLTETEMSLFARVANTIVAYSDLAKRVPSIETEVAELRRQLDHEQGVAKDFADKLHAAMSERDDAQQKLDSARTIISDLYKDQDDLNARVATLSSDLRIANDAAFALRKDRDDAQFRVLELSDEVEKLNAKLSKFRAIFEDEVKAVPSPKAEPIPSPVVTSIEELPEPMSEPTPPEPTGYVPFEETPSTEPTAEPQPTATPVPDVPYGDDPVPTTGDNAPASEPEPERVYARDVGHDAFWNNDASRDARWDAGRNSWYYPKPTTA